MEQNLTKRSNILFRTDTWEKIEEIAKSGNGTPSTLVRFALYEFLKKYDMDDEYKQHVDKHSPGITRSIDALYQVGN